MNQTPRANRKHIVLYGKTNSGKSSIFNAIIGQDLSIVSSIKGTTTDPIIKSMELISFGPITLIDTAGLDDKTELGELRIKQSLKMLQRADFALYIMDANDLDELAYKEMADEFKKFHIPHSLIINKVDAISKDKLKLIKEKYKDAIFVSVNDEESIIQLRSELISKLKSQESENFIRRFSAL